MLYLITTFWLWLLAALVLGLVAGWLTVKGRSASLIKDCWPWALGLGIGALVVGLKLFPGRSGLWVDLGVMLAASYFMGCLIAYGLRGAGRGELFEPATGSDAASAAIRRADSILATSTKVTGKTGLKEVAVEPAASETAKASPLAIEEAITGLSGPRAGEADDLTQIYGIDRPTEVKLNALGIYHLDQLAVMSPGQQRWLLARLGHEDRFPSWWWRWKFDAEQILAGRPVGGSDQSMSAASGVKAFDETGSAGKAAARIENTNLANKNEASLDKADRNKAPDIGAKSVRAKSGKAKTPHDDTNDNGQNNVVKLDKPTTRRPKKS